MGVSRTTSQDLWDRINVTIPPLTTVSVDTIPTSDFDSVQYRTTIKNVALSKRKSISMTVVRSSTGMKDDVSSKVGDNIKLKIDSDIVGSDYELIMENQESFSLDVEMNRLIST